MFGYLLFVREGYNVRQTALTPIVFSITFPFEIAYENYYADKQIQSYIKKVWNGIIIQYKEAQPHLYKTLSSDYPSLENKKELHFTVENNSQLEWLKIHKQDEIEKLLRERMKVHDLKLIFKIRREY